MPRIGIITGVKTEEAALVAVLGGPDAPCIRLSGARPGRARSGVAALLDVGVDGILSFGAAGGVSPVVSPGDVLVADRVITEDAREYQADPDWTDRIATALSTTKVSIAGFETIANASEKARLHERGVAGIDMESHIAAELAGEAGVPFAVLRAVVDPAGFNIPNYALDSVRADGSISLLPIVAGVCTEPWTIGRLLDLNNYNKKAMDALSSAARVLGPGFGLFAL